MDFLVSALRDHPYWGYVHGGRVNHCRCRQEDRIALCGVAPATGARWRQTHQTAFGLIGNGRRNCSTCVRILHDHQRT
jgi:hypothetical protein